MTGKNVRYVAMTTTLVTFAPSAKTIIGARAMIGIVWLATTYGTNERSSQREWTNRVARPRPRSVPRANPRNASRHVYSAASNRNWATLRSAPRCHGSRKTRPMFQMWGRFRSFAKAQRNGGSQITSVLGRSPGGRHGVPPRNFEPSHSSRIRPMRPAKASGPRQRPRVAVAGRRGSVAAAVAIG